MKTRFRLLRNTYGGHVPRHMAVDREASARAVQDRSTAITVPERMSHPAIAAPQHRCYRVIRRFTVNGRLAFEDIGAFATFGNALSMSTREIGYAIILDLNNKQVSYNGQPIEARTA